MQQLRTELRSWTAARMRIWRTRRMQQLAALLQLTPETRILDVGGTPDNWLLLPFRPRVTLVNMPRAGVDSWPGFECAGADGCALPFRDKAFDVVFSNSVIEHVGAPERQAAFAEEVRRVGQRYWVQTPNYWFPVEPHLLTPVVHWLPRGLRREVVSRWTVWEALERPSADRRDFYIRHFLNDIRLLAPAELQGLFPDGRLLVERSAGLAKSLIMYRI